MKELKCPECGKEFSNTEQACPNCGCPAIDCTPVKNNQNEITSSVKESRKQNENKYTKSTLLPNEQVISIARWSWLKNWLVSILLFIATIVIFVDSIISYQYYRDMMVPISKFKIWFLYYGGWHVLICLLLTIVVYYVCKWVNKYDEFVITNKRVIAYYGFIWRAAFELKIDQLESITIYQGLFARLFGFGMVKVCGIGASKAKVHFVKDPFEFRQHFFDLKYAEKNNTLS